MIELRITCDAKAGEVEINDFVTDINIIADMIDNGQLAGKQPCFTTCASITWNLLSYPPAVQLSCAHSIFHYCPNDNGDSWDIPVFHSTWRLAKSAHRCAKAMRVNWPGHLFAVLPVGKLPLRTRS